VFTGADLSAAVFDDCSWLRCELSNCKVSDTRFRRASFTECRARGVTFSNCHRFALEFEFVDCNLSYSSFFGLHIRGTSFKNCKLDETDFGEAQLVDSNFEGSDLHRTVFHHADLRNCDMSTAKGVSLKLENNRVKGLRLSLEGASDTLAALGITVVL